ncbi:PAS domain S-box protein [Bradyrhizobium sp. STM 3557]|uniref:PAS domain S-box protein n=1 Tax=Bradyrhizobium sp. STM 3557 TaxID=578920 RepID=UPI00388D5419
MHGKPGAPAAMPAPSSSSTYLAAIVASSADAILGTTRDGTIRSWNAACERLFGRTSEEMIGQSVLDVIPGELWDEEQEILARVAAGASIENYETVRLAADGRPIEAAVTLSPIRDALGVVIGISSVVRDISEKKQAERGAAMLAAIITSTTDGVVSKTLDGIVTSWNKSAERILGYTEADMLNQSIRKIIPPDRQAEEDRILATVLAGDIIDNFETVRVRKDGALIDVAVTVSPVRDATGRIVGASKIVRDITDKRQTREQLRTLLAEVNHRSKNLLSLVQAIARQMTRQGQQLDLDRFLERLQALAGNQDLLIRNDWRFIPLGELVHSQLRSFGDAIGSRIRIEGPPIELTPEAAQAIGMAMHELATNAAKYGALANKEGRIDIGWAREGPSFTMCWIEQGGPPVTPPTRSGFGSKVISDMVRLSLDGAVDVQFPASGLRWHLSCPIVRITRGRSDAGQ